MFVFWFSSNIFSPNVHTNNNNVSCFGQNSIELSFLSSRFSLRHWNTEHRTLTSEHSWFRNDEPTARKNKFKEFCIHSEHFNILSWPNCEIVTGIRITFKMTRIAVRWTGNISWIFNFQCCLLFAKPF